MRTLLASSGSALGRGHGHAGRGLGLIPSDAAPKERTARGNAHTQYILYTLFDECVARGPTQWLHPPLRFLRLASASLAVSVTPPPSPPAPHYTFLSHCLSSGAGVATPTLAPPEWREYGRHGACVARHAHRRRGDRHMQKAGCVVARSRHRLCSSHVLSQENQSVHVRLGPQGPAVSEHFGGAR